MALTDLIGEHRGAFEFDWRSRFGIPLTGVPTQMGWDEALRMLKLLANDPTSWVHASLAGWTHPVSWDFIALADLFDVQLRSKSKRRPKPYRRPWDKRPVVHGHGQSVSIDRWRSMRPNHNPEGR